MWMGTLKFDIIPVNDFGVMRILRVFVYMCSRLDVLFLLLSMRTLRNDIFNVCMRTCIHY